MVVYEVVIDDEVVWTGETEEYEGLNGFPEELRGRPVSGQVRLIIDGVTVATMQSSAADERDKAEAALAALAALEQEKGL